MTNYNYTYRNYTVDDTQDVSVLLENVVPQSMCIHLETRAMLNELYRRGAIKRVMAKCNIDKQIAEAHPEEAEEKVGKMLIDELGKALLKNREEFLGYSFRENHYNRTTEH